MVFRWAIAFAFLASGRAGADAVQQHPRLFRFARSYSTCPAARIRIRTRPSICASSSARRAAALRHARVLGRRPPHGRPLRPHREPARGITTSRATSRSGTTRPAASPRQRRNRRASSTPANVHHWMYSEKSATGLYQPHLWMGSTELLFATMDDAAFRALADARAAQKFTHVRGLVAGRVVRQPVLERRAESRFLPPPRRARPLPQPEGNHRRPDPRRRRRHADEAVPHAR